MANQSFELTMCFQDPQAGLAKAFELKDINLFQTAITHGGNLDMLDNTSRSIFDRALQTPGYSDFIKICLENGCDVKKMNSILKKYPIHFAVESLDPNNLRELLNYNPDINAPYESESPMHLYCKLLNDENYENIFNCMKLLIKHNANMNCVNEKGLTPIVILLQSKSGVKNVDEILKYFLNNSKIDLDSCRKGLARKLFKNKFENIKLPEKEEIHYTNIDFDYLQGLLREHKEYNFIEGLNQIMNSNDNQHNKENILKQTIGNDNLLQIAILEGLINAVKCILEHNADPNQYTGSYSPIQMACQKGHFEILKYLLNHKNIKLRHPNKPLLCIIIEKLSDQSRDSCNYIKCFDLLINQENIDINEFDTKGSTALHYAVCYKDKYATEILLKKGAYIGRKNKLNDFAISDINPGILENYFDSCIETNGLRPGDPNFEIIFNYSCLVPDKVRETNKIDQNNKRSAYNELQTHVEEMLPIDYMTKTPELRRLVKHPLISSFLWLKWNRLGAIFYTNFALYSVFCLSMILYLVFCYGHETQEWIANTLYTISFIGVIYVILREFIQFIMLSWNYFRLFENYVEIALILITMLVLSAAEFEDSYRRMLAAVAILLAAAEFSLLVGSLPIMSMSTHLVMLKTVSVTFMRGLVLYSIIIVSFALCFYTLLGGGEINDEEERFNTFVDPGTAIIKTIVMFTGEFEAANIKFDTNKTTYFIFVLFVFFISIVLLNLLNGLAVSDTQVIKSEAELTGFIYRSQLLTRYEKMLLGHTNSSCSTPLCRNWLIKKFSGNLISVFPNFLPKARLILKPNEGRKVFIEKKLQDLYDVKGSKENLNNIESQDRYKQETFTPSGLSIFCCLCKTSQIDIKILKYSQNVLDNKSIKQEIQEENEKLERRMCNIEETLNKILIELRTIQK